MGDRVSHLVREPASGFIFIIQSNEVWTLPDVTLTAQPCIVHTIHDNYSNSVCSINRGSNGPEALWPSRSTKAMQLPWGLKLHVRRNTPGYCAAPWVHGGGSKHTSLPPPSGKIPSDKPWAIQIQLWHLTKSPYPGEIPTTPCSAERSTGLLRGL